MYSCVRQKFACSYNVYSWRQSVA